MRVMKVTSGGAVPATARGPGTLRGRSGRVKHAGDLSLLPTQRGNRVALVDTVEVPGIHCRPLGSWQGGPAVDRRDSVAGVVLAAGTSSRMGRNKLLLDLGGQTVLRRAVSTALDAGLEPVLVVLGHESDRARGELQGLAAEVVFNPGYAEGIHSSVRTGIGAVPARCNAAVVLLADMPLVDARMIRTLVDRYRAGAAPLVVSEYEGVDAPPILYDRGLFPELRALEGEGCGKRVVRAHTAEAVRVRWPARALTDLDRPEDLELVRTELGGAR
jgi:molybdenum cofactor cytidylyltransferase